MSLEVYHVNITDARTELHVTSASAHSSLSGKTVTFIVGPTSSNSLRTTRCKIQKLYRNPTQCMYVFCVDLRTNSDYFPVQH
jgi:hypothetical protein